MRYNSKKPNFFICGSPKAGTTSVYEHLKLHPEVFMSPAKEPNYFCSDVGTEKKYKTKGDYLKLFKNAKEEKVIGEATTTYFVSETAPEKIRQFNPRAKILIMTRDKYEVLYSFFYQRVHGGTAEEIDDFETWFVERLIKKKGNYPVWRLLEPDRCISNFRRIFDKNLLTIRLEDYSKSPANEYKKITKFLGIDTSFKPDFQVYNKRREYRSRALRLAYFYLTKTRLDRLVPEKIKRSLGKVTKKEK